VGEEGMAKTELTSFFMVVISFRVRGLRG